MLRKHILGKIFLVVGAGFLVPNSHAEVVTVNWTGSVKDSLDIPSSDSRSLSALGIIADYSVGTPFTVSFSYDSTTQPFQNGYGEAYFQGISFNISIDGKLTLSNLVPTIRLMETSDSWYINLSNDYPNLPGDSFVYFNDILNNQTKWAVYQGVNFAVQNSNKDSNAFNGIGLSYNQLPTATQMQQVASQIVVSAYGSDPNPTQIGFALLQGHGDFSQDYYGNFSFQGYGTDFTVAPEPSALSLLAVGLGGLAVMRRLRS
jgi:hypothetical protein